LRRIGEVHDGWHLRSQAGRAFPGGRCDRFVRGADLAGRVSTSQGKASWAWLLGGAIAMGTGIWSMHFIGMLAFSVPIPLAYDVPITMLSMLSAIVVSGIALYVMRRPSMTTGNLSTGATLMGVGICVMH